VAVTGANGAVGQAILRAARRAGAPLEIVALVRSERAAAALQPLLGPTGRVARVSYHDPASLDAALEAVPAVIHLAGVLVERADSTYEEAHLVTTRHVVEAAKRGAVDTLVLVSAIGAGAGATNRYWRTKFEAEALVRASGLPCTVLRVPLLLGRGTEGAAALGRRLSRGVAILIGGGRTLQQPLDVDDLARAALAAAGPGAATGRTLELVGPESLTEREILERAARLVGRRLRIWSVPRRLVRLALATRQRLAGPGFSTDALEVLTTDTRVDPGPAATALGLTLTGVDDMIRRSVAPEADP
jgi:NADH dehydrogenase